MASPLPSYGIIGGGIIGLALAYKLLERQPGARITVFEKEAEVGRHQSGHNSGVLHAGLYYKPGSLKAKLAVNGIRQMVDFCRKQSIPHEICGKLVVAVSGDEIPGLRELFERGTRNGLQGLKWLEQNEIREIEPHAAGLAAVHVPEEGIVDYPAVCRTLRREIEAGGGRVLTGSAVRALRPTASGWVILAGSAEQETGFLFNCAGLHCDLVMAMAGEPRRTRIVPFRGEYYELNESGRSLVRNLIYPVPDPKFPFLGVHFTRMIRGGVEAGPNAVLALAREGYRKRDISLTDLADVFTYSGFWRFLARYPRMCAYEMRRSFSRQEFCRSLQRLVPDIELKHLSEGGSGIRAQALSPDGTLVQDFEYVLRRNALHLMNAPSPGATASLAIADHLLNAASVAGPSSTGPKDPLLTRGAR